MFLTLKIVSQLYKLKIFSSFLNTLVLKFKTLFSETLFCEEWWERFYSLSSNVNRKGDENTL